VLDKHHARWRTRLELWIQGVEHAFVCVLDTVWLDLKADDSAEFCIKVQVEEDGKA
jgi:hypothetical protein